MAFESKKTPGKKFGSIFQQKHYDENHSEDGMHSESPEHEARETPEFEAGEQEGAVEHKAEEHEGEEHPEVSEHGSAHKVVISHDEKTGRHTVTSHHKDGHVHTSVHEHAHKAHDEARQLASVPPAGKEEGEEHMGAMKDHKGQEGAPSEEDGFSMPNLV
jgi:hypothetical protein